MDTILWGVVVALAIGGTLCTWWVVKHAGLEVRVANESRDEYKELFETGDAEYKKSQQQIQELLTSASDKDVVITRAAQSLDLAGQKLSEQSDLLTTLDEKLRFSENQYSKLLSQKKSSEVRTGMIAEQIAPFLEDYPKNPATARFIGDPIDFVHFDDDRVTFVEVKSGKSQLSKKQRHIRDLIDSGKVSFTIYRIKGDTPPKKDDGDGDNGTD